VERARAAGARVALDPNLRLHHWSDTAPLARDVESLVEKADLVKLSTDEIHFVAGTHDPAEAARRLVARGPALAVVTCGEAGCVWARRRDGVVEEGAIPTRAAALVDTTGAGDGFQAALLTGLSGLEAKGEDALVVARPRFERLVARSLEAGTRVCEAMGAVAGLPTRAALGPLDV
jgi:sugar/nucleoside kinase (ribokinase family)